MFVFFVIYFTCHCNELLIIKSLSGITLLFCKATIVHVTFNSCLSDPVYCVLESFFSCPFRCNVIFIFLICPLEVSSVCSLSFFSLLQVGRAVWLHGRVGRLKLGPLTENCHRIGEKVRETFEYLRFELSLDMRGNAVISTEKRWAL